MLGVGSSNKSPNPHNKSATPDTHITINKWKLYPNSDPDWGLHRATVVAPKELIPTVRYCLRRLRNSLGHTSFVYSIPKVMPDGQNLYEAVTVNFQDHNPKDPADAFQVVLNSVECVKLTAKLRQTVHAYVMKKYGL